MLEFVGNEIVVDVQSMFVFLGRLTEVRDKELVLLDADVHDLRDSATTREAYIRGARIHGIQPNRRRVLIRMDEVVSLSVLQDVIQ